MLDKKLNNKGPVLEEALRAFFLRAGFFVIRGVPFRFADEDLTDVDLWLYERPTGTARRIQICDIKYKQRPKAVERILWTHGLAAALDVDGAYVATTDKRRGLRQVAGRLDIQLIDGNDIQRILNSNNTLYDERISDEELIQQLQSVDADLRSKNLQSARIDILSALSDGFGAKSVVRSLENFIHLARALTEFHPSSAAAICAGRLAYLAAAIACQSIDYVSVSAAFRTLEEKHQLILNVVRSGALSDDAGQQTLRLALALVEKYGQGGKSAARSIEDALQRDLETIPAEIIADQSVRLLANDQLFNVGRELEMAAYMSVLPSFDVLTLPTKSMIGAMLDYGGIDRKRFADAWDQSRSGLVANGENLTDYEAKHQSPLF